MSNKSGFSWRLAVFAGLSCFSPVVFAYLDPSTGSMILSAIVGVLATVGLALKTYWYKLKSFFSGGKSAAENSPPQTDSDLTADQRSD